MAMTAQVKAELSSTQITKTCCRKAEVASMLRFAGGLHIVSGKIVVEAELDTGAAARRLRKDIAEVYGHSSDVVMVQGAGIRKDEAHAVRILQAASNAGVVEAKLAGYGLLGKEAPAFVALPALPVTRDTLLDGWKAVYSTDATDNVKKSLGQ